MTPVTEKVMEDDSRLSWINCGKELIRVPLVPILAKKTVEVYNDA